MSKNTVNEFVRRKVRELRKSRKMKIREIATLTGMPYSSYASLESGFYNINLDNLFRILGALEADIHEVWPVETAVTDAGESELYLKRIQQFRLAEVIALAGAEGGALFAVNSKKRQLLLHQGLSDFLLDRLILYLEESVDYKAGLWFSRERNGKRFEFFLKGEGCPEYLGGAGKQIHDPLGGAIQVASDPVDSFQSAAESKFHPRQEAQVVRATDKPSLNPHQVVADEERSNKGRTYPTHLASAPQFADILSQITGEVQEEALTGFPVTK